MPDKYDEFNPRRSSSVDGFITGAGQRPRQPVFRNNVPQEQRQATNMAPDASRRDELPRPLQNRDFVQTPRPQQTAEAYQPPSQDRMTRDPQPIRPVPELKPAPGEQKRDAQKPKEGKRGKRIFKRILKIFGVLVLLAVLVLGARFYKDIARLTGNGNPFSLLNVFKPAHLDNENGRVNVLVAGNSADDLGHNGGELTDSIMVLSLDTRKNKAMMLSIPRDLWVKIPGEGYGKINSAYPAGGMDTLADIIETELDIPVHYKVLINYAAFKDLVNAVGGITINIESDDPRGIYDPNIDWTSRRCCALAKYPNGPVTLNGQQALNLARARGDPNPFGIPYGFEKGDFTRTENQRKMLLAIKAKASSASVVANPLKVSNLVSAVGGNVKSDLEVAEIQSLYFYMKKVNDADIDSYNINTLKGENTTMLQNYTSPNGQSALIPAAGIDDFSEIAAQIQKVFTAGPLLKEAAVTVILNGTDTVGLARKEGSKLENKGLDVVAYGDAPAAQTTTTIIDNSAGKKPRTVAELKKRYNATVVSNATLTANYPNADIILILGANVAQQSSSQSSNQTR